MSAATAVKGKEADKSPKEGTKRTYISQSDVPKHPLEGALGIARAISDQYAKKPTKPLNVAIALDMAPGSRAFRDLAGASEAYGLTEGASQAGLISLTTLGRRAVAPTVEGDDLLAKREAVLQPRIMREFLSKYDEEALPRETIAYNVLQELGIAKEATARVLALILENARNVGFVTDHRGRSYVSLDSPPPANDEAAGDEDEDEGPSDADSDQAGVTAGTNGRVRKSTDAPPQDLNQNKRVFITHGSNKDIVNQLKDLLTYGGLEPVVSVEKETVAKPVPDKVMDDMRSCGAAIVHVGSELRLVDQEGKEHRMVNPNVLIEIGAAMALFGRRFILLVERGVTLPSNLQGLYEVRYEGEKLDYDATLKLLKAFNEFRS